MWNNFLSIQIHHNYYMYIAYLTYLIIVKTKNTEWGTGYKGRGGGGGGGYVYQLGKVGRNMNLEKKMHVCVPVFGEDRYMYAIQIINRKRLCGTLMEGIYATPGGDMWL